METLGVRWEEVKCVERAEVLESSTIIVEIDLQR